MMVTDQERQTLTPWQVDVLTTMRTYKSVKVTASKLNRSTDAVYMAMMRIRKRGVSIGESNGR